MSQRISSTTTPERSKLMAGVRQTGTSNELLVQKLLRSLGYRFTVKASDLPGTPDIVNRSRHWAIFVHGCFWHAHSCHLWKLPKGNRAFWEKKFAANKKRDKAKLTELRRKGYSVLTVWQCELKNEIKVRRKLQDFLNGTNGHAISIIEPKQKTDTVSPSFCLDEQNRRVSRTTTTAAGSSFTTTFDLTKSVSTKQDTRSIYDQTFLRSVKPPWHSPLKGIVRAADLFSGCGGLSLGTREACTALGKGFKSVLAIDEDLSSLEVYKRNFSPTVPINGDIWSVLSGEIGARLQKEEKTLLKKMGAVDICLAGPPCQGHSDLNNHTRRKDKRNHLYERVARFAEIAEPSHLIIENVPNVINAKDRSLDKTITRLEKLGYKVDTSVVQLAELGVPQRRKRDILIASSSRLSVQDIISRHTIPNARTLRWGIADLARRAPGSLLDTPSKLHPDNVERIEYLMKHDKYDLPNELRPICHHNDHSYVSMYGRLRYNEPAQTITSGFGSPGQGRFIHPTCGRTLTAHEAARLQFFPDTFDFSTVRVRTSLANMIGNAVPILLSLIVAMELLTR